MPDPILIMNPRRKRRHKKRTHSRRRRRTNPRAFRAHSRRRRRNPRSFGGVSLSPMSVVRSTVIPAAIGGAGAVGLDVALAYLPLPDSLKSGLAATAVKLAGAVGLGFLIGKVLKKPDMGRMVSLGAVTVMGYQFIRDQAKTALPTVKGLGGYQDYVDYRLTADRGTMGAYMSPQPLGFISPAPVVAGSSSGMGAYMSPDLVPTGMGGYDWAASDGM